MDLKELRQQQARRVRQMRPRATLDLREIRLADSSSSLTASVLGMVRLLDGPHQLLLRHRTAQPAKVSFDFAQITDFVAQFHIANCDNNITICNMCKQSKVTTTE